MKRIDRLIIKELVGPWLFGVAMFSVLLIAASFLFQLTNLLVQGVAFWTVLKVGALLMPSVFVKTFAMAMLLAGLLGFGRLSGDSEIIALRAGGASIVRMIGPVAVMALLVALLAFTIDETVVPWSREKGTNIAADIAKHLDPASLHITSQPITVNGKTVGVVIAQNYDQLRQVLMGATVVGYAKDGSIVGYIYAKELVFDAKQIPTGNGWVIQGGAVFISGDGSEVIHFHQGDPLKKDAGPLGMPDVNMTPRDILARQLSDPDVLSMAELAKQINIMRKDPNHQASQLNNLEFFYWNKIALPLATFVYGLLGAPLGIRKTRTSAAAGFALAVAILFGYLTLTNLLNVYAMGGVIPPVVASFTPILVGCVAAVIIIYRRNF